ncbi:MAG: hypothetical protein ACN6RD_03305 [Stenotrophomonas maltophilia]
MRTFINEERMIADVGSGCGQGGITDRFGKAEAWMHAEPAPT